MRFGRPAMGEACCCEEEECVCPDDCSAMGDTRTITFSGFTSTYAVMNGVAITLNRLGCEWFTSGAFFNDCYEGYNILVACIDGEWIVQLQLMSWGEPDSGSCDTLCEDGYQSTGRCGDEPPLGEYAMQLVAGGDGCDENEITAELEKP